MDMKKLLLLVLALCMTLCLCACGGDVQEETVAPPQETEGSEVTEEVTEAPTETEPAGIVYTVTVVDEGGNPLPGIMVQICQGELCLMPSATDANGVAKLTAMDEGEYEAKLLSLPEGYEYTTEEQAFVFGDAYELTITLKAVA